MQRIKRVAAAIWLLCLILWCLPVVSAIAEPPVWTTIQGTNLYVYLATDEVVEQVQVRNTECTNLQAASISELEVPVETIVLLDNSISISVQDRSLVKQILENLIGNRLPGELFTIATMDTDIHYLCQKEGEYLTLHSLVDGIEYNDQDTRLTDGLYQLLEDLQASDDGTLRRVVLICDGVDNRKLSYTHEEIVRKVQQVGYPLYAIGCTNSKANGNELIENLFELSRLTQGKTVYLGDSRDPLQIAGIVDEYNTAQQLIVALPEVLCDGSVQGVQITQASNQIYTMQVNMPFAQPSLPEPSSSASMDASEELVESEPEEAPSAGLNPLLVLIPVTLIAVLVGTVFLFRMKKTEKQAALQNTADNATQRVQPEKGEATIPVFNSQVDDDATAAVWNSDQSKASLLLVDCSNSLHRYEVPLQGIISVGRAPSCRVVLDYDRTVGRHQCDIYMENGEPYVRNVSQTNPTILNGCVLTESRPVASGSTLRLGNVELQVDVLYGGPA